VRPNVALRAGVGQMRTQNKREYLPAIRQDIQLRTEILSVPMTLGADYYFAPYNQGDFQARAFFGAGMLNTVQNRVLFQSYELGTDPSTTLFGTRVTRIERDAPGWYTEIGAHVLRDPLLRGAEQLLPERPGARAGADRTNTTFPNLTDGRPTELDLSGIGGRERSASASARSSASVAADRVELTRRRVGARALRGCGRRSRRAAMPVFSRSCRSADRAAWRDC